MSKTNSVIFILSALLLLETIDSLAASPLQIKSEVGNSTNACPSNCVATKDNTPSCIGDEMPCTENGINYCCYTQPPLSK
ncbi:MAG: hypothetical protein K2Y08_05675 [Alphaproteobacteria bacterium]|nr:hypothetical protein [Alphaproteobacteria bacterium]